jgi:hypothetical protein
MDNITAAINQKKTSKSKSPGSNQQKQNKNTKTAKIAPFQYSQASQLNVATLPLSQNKLPNSYPSIVGNNIFTYKYYLNNPSERETASSNVRKNMIFLDAYSVINSDFIGP